MGTLAAGIKEIFATAKTTGSNVMLCGNDGTPDGHMTMANLASVLGATQNYSGDLDYLVNPGVYTLMTTQQHTPFGNNSWGVVIVSGNSDLFRSQLAIADNKMAFRGGLNNQANFVGASWYRCDNFGCNDLSSLANALGVTKRMEFVDLGLPSGTLWATRNLGAETPEDYGYYFSWGNVIGHKPNGTTFDYDWGTDNSGIYASTPGAALTGDIPTNMDYDAVQRYMGGSCKMPTKDQFVELFNSSYTTNEWTTKNGVNGRLVTSKINSNSVFFPATGNGKDTSLRGAGSYSNYWSRSFHSSASGYNFSFDSSSAYPQNATSGFCGFSVRAVQ